MVTSSCFSSLLHNVNQALALMGLISSRMASEPQVVLVPPLFERDHRGRSRMAKSSYDTQFGKPQLKWLFNDYIWPAATSLLRFSPEEDRRVTVKARLGTSLDGAVGSDSAGAISLRFQPEPDEQLTFVDLKAAAQTGAAQLRACYLNTDTGLGVFARLPLTGDSSAGLQTDAGVRFSSAEFSTGIICQPIANRLSHLWLVGQRGPFTLGWQLRPKGALEGFLQNAQTQFGQQLRAAHAASSYTLAYSPPRPPAGGGAFTTIVELREQRALVVSFLHHMAVQRLCHNPFEDDSVAGIANYLDIGLQVVTLLGGGRQSGGRPEARQAASSAAQAGPAPDLCFAVQLQANKNLVLKAKMGTQGVAAAVALKAWWQPSWMAAASWGWDFATQRPRLGLALHLENYGNIRYERSQEPHHMGKALMQRHVALPEEIANKKGKGLLVDKDHIQDPATLGQVRRQSDHFL